MKANHNNLVEKLKSLWVVSNGSKILIWKQITTSLCKYKNNICCFQWFKDTNLKANHNKMLGLRNCSGVVSNGSKILIWKQITTYLYDQRSDKSCFQWFKDTNLKANHNWTRRKRNWDDVVSNGSKILIWKQITTKTGIFISKICCFQWFKDTNLKANHNYRTGQPSGLNVVSNGSKILIWKQITTNSQWEKHLA